jgi:beta-glucanase (GH16 family)
MRGSLSVLLLMFFIGNAHAQKKKLIWSDEFNYKGLPDSTKWSYDFGNTGWGNNELQFYTSRRKENARIEKGHLIITAIKEKYRGSDYTSARLITKHKGDWQYGRIEVRAKLPLGRGIWPAIWMLPTDLKYGVWPHSGEIDIMEHVGYMPDSVFMTIHTGKYSYRSGVEKTKGVYFDDLHTKFHVYAINWTTNLIEFFIDDKKYLEFRKEKQDAEVWPFDERFHLLLNIAVGGSWGGLKGIDNAVFPQRMMVDYVRVYSLSGKQ